MEYRWLYDVPSAPAVKEMIPGNGQLLVYFYPPILDGGTPITGYEYSLDGSSFIFVRNTVSPMTIRGLTNGQLYSVVIRAVNIVGHGPPSEPTEGTPVTAPSAPIITGITHGDSQLIVTFIAPSTGGSPIIDYQYSVNNGSTFTSAGITSPITINGLTNGQSYQVVIRAVNSVGSGYPSNMMTGVPSTVPSAPIITEVTPSNEQLTVYFTVPSDGGSPVTGYRYSKTEPYQWIDAGLNNPITITGLTNGQPYPIRIQAVNINGEGTSEPVEGTPATVPGAPHITEIARGNGQLLVTFDIPSLTGGSPITGYQYSTNGGTFSAPVPAPENQILITGLTNGQSYQVVIRAVNIIGAGIPSNMESGTPATTPSAPRITRVIPGDAQLTVYFVPSFNGGSPITGYQYSTDNGVTFPHTVEPVNNVIIISGLTNGIVYQVIIRAVNEVGDGANSNMVTKYPVSVPSAPTITRIGGPPIALSTNEVGNVIVVMFMTPPEFTGGSPITDYQYSVGDSFISIGLPTLINIYGTNQYVLMINGLPIDTTYEFVLRASNAIGSGALSNPVSGNTNVTTPESPTIINIEAGDTKLIVDFEPPFINGGSPIIYYQYSVDNGENYTNVRVTPVIGSFPTITITGLINDKTYDVIITAVNQFGPGAPSNMVQGTPSYLPSAPIITEITPGDTQLTVSIIPPLLGKNIEYQYSINGGNTFSIPFSLVPPVNSFPITGLTNCTAYPIVVRAVNAIGVGPNSNTVTGTPGVPSAPTITGITAGEKSLTVAFTIPSYGDPTGYQYSTDNGGTFSPGNNINNTITITATSTNGAPLIDGQSYQVVIRAFITNCGNGIPSAPFPGIPGIVPGPPTITVASGNGQLSVTVTSSAPNIIGYRYSVNSGALVPPLTDSPINQNPFTITGLTNGISYSVVVYAVNISGTGPGSTPKSGTPSTVPGAPTDIMIASGNGQLSVTFTAPSTGGSAITDYQYSISTTEPYQWTSVGLDLSFIISNLTNGQSYSVVVRAVNKNGNSNPSIAKSGTPGTVPDAPVLFGILSGDRELSVGFCPVLNANPPIIRYECTATLGGSSVTQSGTTSPIVIPGLLNGFSYSVVVRSVNVYGKSVPSNSLSGTPGTASAPRISGITPGIAQLSVAFVAPISDGGFAITSYQCTATPVPPASGSSVIQSGTTSPIFITGLSNITYHVQMLAVNEYGAGTISNMVEGTPVTVPGVPTITSITPGNGTLSVAFTAPSTGGSPILYYQYSLSLPPSNWVNAGTTSPIQITGLSNGTTYSVTIRAVNVYGNSNPSATASATTIVPLPSAPTITEIDPDVSGQLFVYFNISTPTPVTGYKYSTDNGSTFPGVGFVSPIPIHGLTNGTTYQVIIRAYNSSGDGAISNMVEAISGAPSAPIITGIIPGNGTVTINFNPPSYDGGYPINFLNGYEYSINGGSYIGIITIYGYQININNLSNNITYTIAIHATNVLDFTGVNAIVIVYPGRPSAPTDVVLTPGDSQLTVTFTAPSDGGVSPITGYQYSIDGGNFADIESTYPLKIYGLTNGTLYQIVIRATNPNGPGAPSIMVPGIPSTTPSAPVITSIVPGNGQLFVYFTPGSDGGSAIIAYDYSTDGGSNYRVTQTITSPITITLTSNDTPLINGTPYYVIIGAINSNGNGSRSTLVSGTPGLPTAPTITGITPGNGILSVAFTPPSSDGGFLITGYKYTAFQATGPFIIQSGGTTSPFIFTGLTNGASYTVEMQAVNSIGPGAFSIQASGTPISAPSLPSAPYISEITPGNQQLLVSYCPPISNGGFPITSYQYSTNNGSSFTVVGSITSPFTIFGLTNGIHYDVIIYAVNSYGGGDYSNMVVGTPNA